MSQRPRSEGGHAEEEGAKDTTTDEGGAPRVRHALGLRFVRHCQCRDCKLGLTISLPHAASIVKDLTGVIPTPGYLGSENSSADSLISTKKGCGGGGLCDSSVLIVAEYDTDLVRLLLLFYPDVRASTIFKTTGSRLGT
jgi:hypothetical protein